MLTLSPWKILVIVVVALLVLGPEKLPAVARQVGGFWGDLRRLRARLEDEVRGVFPDLPPSHEVARAVRSPLAYLDRLADEHDRQAGSGASAGPAGGVGEGTGPAPAAVSGDDGTPGGVPVGRARPPAGAGDELALPVPDDPSMN
jgi:sec-independent protein translocase protein TatB